MIADIRAMLDEWTAYRRGDVVGEHLLYLLIGFFMGVSVWWR